MSKWQDECLPMLRILINDFSSEPKYTDQRLSDILIAAAFLVNQEVAFFTQYKISVMGKTIAPDPVTNNDDQFISFMVLKGACMADQSTYRTRALLEGIKANMGPATLEISGNLEGFSRILSIGPCAAYKEVQFQKQFGETSLSVRAILSPFTGNKFDPSLLNSNEPRDRSFYGR